MPTLPDWLVNAIQVLTVLLLAPLVTGVIARLGAFDLLVTGHHRTGRAGRLLLHGVPEQLVAAADIPVLVVGEAGGNRRQLR